MATLSYSEVYDTTTYTDWTSVVGTGADYQSYFVTGYKVHAEGLRQFQGNYLVIYSNIEANSSAFVQYLWDYATNSLGKRMSTPEQLYIGRNYVSVVPRRVWLRGQGLALQVKFYSESGKPFNIIGYAVFETSNANV